MNQTFENKAYNLENWQNNDLILKLEKKINFRKLKLNYNSLINEYLSRKKKKSN